MSKNLEKANQIVEAIPGVVDLLTLGVCGIIELANVIKYNKCEIYIKNNHYHDISVVLDVYDKNKLKGWYNIEAFTKTKIFKTERRTYKVGIYAECSECDKIWGCEKDRYIPYDGKCFNIEYDPFHPYHYDYKCVQFSYSKDITKEKEYTFTIN